MAVNQKEAFSDEEVERIEEKIFKLLWYITKNDLAEDFESLDFAFSPDFVSALDSLAFLSEHDYLPVEDMQELNELFKRNRRRFHKLKLDEKFDESESVSK